MDNNLEIVYICNECQLVSTNQDEIESHFRQSHAHAFTGEFAQLHGVSIAYVEKNLGPGSGPSSECLESSQNCGQNKEDLQQNTPECNKLWTNKNTLMLIELCRQYDNDFETGVKKYVWQKIAREISKETKITVTPQQCDTKWKGLKITYKQVKKHNKTSGNTHKYWEYFDVINDILHKKPEIEAEATCSSRRGLKVKNGIENRETCVSASPQNDEESTSNESLNSPTTSDTSYKSSFMKKRKISDVEKRHKEKMIRQDKYLELMERMVKIMENADKKEN